ncbi:DNA polymerase III subunit delta [candidate division GN15 bacterium]|nr:DNA polymerase III subunit delta [candidate division GN15 bacterium]
MADPRTLLKDISAGRFKPAYYFFGSEDYRIKEAEKFLAKSFLGDQDLSTGYRRIDGRAIKCADLLAELSTVPMLGDKQVFAIKDFQSFKPTEIERVLKLLDPADPSRVIVFSSPSARTPKKNSKFFTNMARHTTAVEFNHLTPSETASQIRARFKRAGLTIDHDALSILTGLIGGNRGALDTETDKLIDYCRESGSVTRDDVKTLTAGHEVFNVFQIGDLIVQGNVNQCLAMMRSLLASGQTPVMLISLLIGHFLCLYLVKNGQKPLPRREFLTGKFRSQAARYTHEQLAETIVELSRADARLRHSEHIPEMVLESLILQLAGKGES